MSKELENFRRTLQMLEGHMESHKSRSDITYMLGLVQDTLRPPPVYEDVTEVVGWVNVYQRGKHVVAPEVFPTEEDANLPYNVGEGRISCQPIQVTVSREKKQPVERSVSGIAALNAHPQTKTHILVKEEIPYGTKCTVTWQEKP